MGEKGESESGCSGWGDGSQIREAKGRGYESGLAGPLHRCFGITFSALFSPRFTFFESFSVPLHQMFFQPLRLMYGDRHSSYPLFFLIFSDPWTFPIFHLRSPFPQKLHASIFKLWGEKIKEGKRREKLRQSERGFLTKDTLVNIGKTRSLKLQSTIDHRQHS